VTLEVAASSYSIRLVIYVIMLCLVFGAVFLEMSIGLFISRRYFSGIFLNGQKIICLCVISRRDIQMLRLGMMSLACLGMMGNKPIG
jgi:hypothetical protein